MSVGASIILIAVGAILRFAVSLRSSFAGASVNWHIVGDILMAVGIVGLVISLIWMATLNRRDRYSAPARYDDRYDAGTPREPRSTP
jgi:uncharacterized membrane protein YidH (DUF202 family)